MNRLIKQLAQKVPVSGAIIVTTPQDIALLDARKGLKMFEKVDIPILGVVENMSTHICSNCGHMDHIFGEDGAKKLEEEYDATVIGRIPLNTSIRIDSDNGMPITLKDKDGPIGTVYKSIAEEIMKECIEDVEQDDGETDPR